MIIWPRQHQSDLSTPDFDPNCDLKHREETANMLMENGPMENLIVLSYTEIPLAVSRSIKKKKNQFKVQVYLKKAFTEVNSERIDLSYSQ